MPYYYSEALRREPNRRGRPRLVTVLGGLPGALHHGFDGDGTPKGAAVRLWQFAAALAEPLPDGVTELTQSEFETAVADREAAKPPPPPEPPPDPDEELLRAALDDPLVSTLEQAIIRRLGISAGA
ncbi:MAG: hypothetical protein V3R95_02845 [Dehalococcoidia bacterium]